MLKSHEKFHSVNGKRQVLVVDDEFINRELMKAMLEDSYELLFAENGQEALDVMRANTDTLSLVLLDLMMPVMSGTEVLKQAKGDPSTSHIPIIVISADQNAEIESLTLGATDFIPKPYPQQGVIRARILRTIELSEDREIINSTERDALTGLYNHEFFFSYAEQFDQHHKDLPMDAIVVDVNHFHMINERFGRNYGDVLLRQIGESLRASVADCQGIVCRREADTFLIYCPHGMSYESILEQASVRLSSEGVQGSRVWLRMGVYPNADKTIDIERRFDRAKRAADTVQGSFARRIGVYDERLHERELYAEQLIGDFDEAIKEHQFIVYYQPKFDVQCEPPLLASAEALVRWCHPELGIVSPGIFIPLFEDNGLIQRLDLYVWCEVAAQIKRWKDQFGVSIPVSVNVSRVDLYDPFLVDTLQKIVTDNGIDANDLLLEITESAYTKDSSQMIETIVRIRDLGFRVEMDDFGTGYSSLNMISAIPIDALKLDMQFVRSAFSGRQDTRMLEVIIDIADYLSVPTIAEGVETESQMTTLKEMGCDYIQGYYFSKPVPPDEFEQFLIEHNERADIENVRKGYGPHLARRQTILTYASIVRALAMDYVVIYHIDVQTDHFVEYGSQSSYQELSLPTSGEDFFNLTRSNAKKLVHPDDVEMFLAIFTKENVLETIERSGTFTAQYRLMFESGPTYVHMKATCMEDHNDKHIVIGVSNVDDQVRREQERARALRLAHVDALTGVKSKLSYTEEERKINQAIAESRQVPFAIVVCDVNELKYINDTYGHAAGDQYLKDACSTICNVFKHSPIYRIGGDEFVALLRGDDFEARERLMSRLATLCHGQDPRVDVSIAGGLAVWNPEEDPTVSAVFKRADAAMYEDKKRFKDSLSSEGVR